MGGPGPANEPAGLYYGDFMRPSISGSSARAEITDAVETPGGGALVIEAQDFIHIDGEQDFCHRWEYRK